MQNQVWEDFEAGRRRQFVNLSGVDVEDDVDVDVDVEDDVDVDNVKARA